MTSLRDRALAANDREPQMYPVPEWDDDEGAFEIELWPMSMRERDTVQKLATSDDPLRNADILLMIARDPDTHKPMFDEADRDAISEKNGQVVENIVIAALQMSTMSDDEAEASVADDPTSVGA